MTPVTPRITTSTARQYRLHRTGIACVNSYLNWASLFSIRFAQVPHTLRGYKYIMKQLITFLVTLLILTTGCATYPPRNRLYDCYEYRSDKNTLACTYTESHTIEKSKCAVLEQVRNEPAVQWHFWCFK